MTPTSKTPPDLDPGDQTLDHVPFDQVDAAAQERILQKLRKAYQTVPQLSPDHNAGPDADAGAVVRAQEAGPPSATEPPMIAPIPLSLKIALTLFFCGLFLFLLLLWHWIMP